MRLEESLSSVDLGGHEVVHCGDAAEAAGVLRRPNTVHVEDGLLSVGGRRSFVRDAGVELVE